jgi:tRNA-dihydrouridine synthase
MLGRIAAVKPWIFREFAGLPPLAVDYLEVWERLYRYTLEDMPPERAFGRLKEFTFYFAKNFCFGHEMFKGIQKARTPAGIREAALRFLAAGPRLSESKGLPFS